MDKKQLFEEIQAHLLNDDAPSLYFNHICDSGSLDDFPFILLRRLKEVPQSPKHHPEGSVWNHTMLVIDEAAKKKAESPNPAAFMLAALLHDIGKAETTNHDNGRITAYDHDKIGAMRTEEFLKELTKEKNLIHQVSSLVRWHMQILFIIKSMKFADMSNMINQVDPEEIALLGYCDRMGRLNADQKTESENLRLFLKKCHEFQRRH